MFLLGIGLLLTRLVKLTVNRFEIPTIIVAALLVAYEVSVCR